MRKLHSFTLHERAQAAILRDFLEREGIACLIRNEGLLAGLGEIPLVECFPEIWIVDDEVFPRAKMLTQRWLRPTEPQEPWTCLDCGERLEGQFGACWQCGGERMGSGAAG